MDAMVFEEQCVKEKKQGRNLTRGVKMLGKVMNKKAFWAERKLRQFN